MRLCARQSIYLGTFHNGCLTANPFILVKSCLAQRRKGAKFFRIKKSPFIWQNGISVIAISLTVWAAALAAVTVVVFDSDLKVSSEAALSEVAF